MRPFSAFRISRWISLIFLFALACDTFAINIAKAADPEQSILVYNIEGSSQETDLRQTIAAQIANALENLGVLDVITLPQLSTRLDFDDYQKLKSCNRLDCLPNVGRQASVRYIITGDLDRTDRTLDLELRLIDSSSSKILAKEFRQYEEPHAAGSLIQDIGQVVETMTANLTKNRKGTLVIWCNDEGVEIEINGAIVGSTPLENTITLDAGPHTLRARKHGYIDWVRDIRIPANKTKSVEIVLKPSAEFIDQHRKSNKVLRIVAYSAWAVGGAAAVAGGGLLGWNSTRLDSYNSDKNEFDACVTSSCRSASELNSEKSDLDSRQEDINTMDTISYVLLGVGGAAIVTGVVLFFVSDDPDRYDKDTPDKVSVLPMVGLTTDYASAAVRIQF